jgi:hypothetical protein
MNAKTLIAAASLTLLSAAPAAWAQYDRYDHNDRRYPDSRQIERVVAEAHQISETATYMSRQAQRYSRRPSGREAEALDRLRDLSNRAIHFEREVGRYRQDPRHTSADFQAMVDSFNYAERAVQRINGRPYVDRGMDRIAGYLDELAPYYGQEAGFRSRYGYRDRDRDGDRNRDGYRDRGDDRDRGNDRDGYRPPVR